MICSKRMIIWNDRVVSPKNKFAKMYCPEVTFFSKISLKFDKLFRKYEGFFLQFKLFWSVFGIF